MFRIPVVCECGKLVQFTNEHRCEDCFVNDTVRYHGMDQSVMIQHVSTKDSVNAVRRGAEIRRSFQGSK